jgi:nucleotide-binding universal stress UspA family protein
MAEVEELLEEAAQHLSSLGISVETLCREGQPVQEILRVVRDRGVELIVIGTVGRGRREDFLIGSVSQRVKASTERDMLFVRGGGPPGNSRFRAILGVDGSPGSLGAVEAFAKEVQAERADIRVVHVREALGSRPDQTHRRAARSLSTHSGTDYGEEALSNALEILEAHGLSGTTEERRGRPAAELLEAARDYGAHLIVMGSRGLTRPPGMLTGSVTQRVVRHASSSVLCSRRRESVPSVLDS